MLKRIQQLYGYCFRKSTTKPARNIVVRSPPRSR